MKKIYTLLLPCFLITGTAIAQKTAKITFKKGQDTIRRKETSAVYPITIKADSINIDSLNLYTLTVKANDEKSDLPKSAYTLNFNSVTLDKLSPKLTEYTFFITVNPDSAIDRNRHLYLYLEITKGGKVVSVNTANSNLNQDIIVESVKALNKYNYLAYIGTNFDLVDGIQAKNLFFATNLFTPPVMGQGFGFNLTLYGNRTLTLTDTTGRVTYTSRIVGLRGDSARTYREEALKTISRVSDNLGATFSPLFRMGKLSDSDRNTQLYYAPQFEFIWRRTKITTSYTDNVLVDSIDRPNRPITGTLVLTPPKETIPLNVYDVYLGLAGLFLNHENSHISIRVQSSFGFSYSYTSMPSAKGELIPQYDRRWNYFCYVRAWITEPNSGLTFGAEVTNNLIKKNSHQPYYNVTLSKAINFNALGAIFQPIGSR